MTNLPTVVGVSNALVKEESPRELYAEYNDVRSLDLSTPDSIAKFVNGGVKRKGRKAIRCDRDERRLRPIDWDDIEMREALVKYSQYIIADFDYKMPAERLLRDADWVRFKALPYVRAMFTSPKGGIKLIIRHNNDDPAQHKNLMGQIRSAINSNKWDTSGSDISRACFFSYDPDLYENPDCEVFDFEPVKTIVPVAKSTTTSVSVSSSPTISILSETEEMQAIKRVQSWSDANFPICRGYRHSHLHIFAQRLKENRVSKQAATEYLTLKYIGTDKGDELTGAEIIRLVENGYR